MNDSSEASKQNQFEEWRGAIHSQIEAARLRLGSASSERLKGLKAQFNAGPTLKLFNSREGSLDKLMYQDALVGGNYPNGKRVTWGSHGACDIVVP